MEQSATDRAPHRLFTTVPASTNVDTSPPQRGLQCLGTSRCPRKSVQQPIPSPCNEPFLKPGHQNNDIARFGPVVGAASLTGSFGSGVIPCPHPDHARTDHDFPAGTFTQCSSAAAGFATRRQKVSSCTDQLWTRKSRLPQLVSLAAPWCGDDPIAQVNSRSAISPLPRHTDDRRGTPGSPSRE
jgi:hypothetical protein